MVYRNVIFVYFCDTSFGIATQVIMFVSGIESHYMLTLLIQRELSSSDDGFIRTKHLNYSHIASE